MFARRKSKTYVAGFAEGTKSGRYWALTRVEGLLNAQLKNLKGKKETPAISRARTQEILFLIDKVKEIQNERY